MNLLDVKIRLEEYDFIESSNIHFKERKDLENLFFESGLEVWSDEDRVVTIKEYGSNHQFLKYWKEDQVSISYLLETIDLRYKNNLYFILVLNFEYPLSLESLLEMNSAEKNAKVCRKYTIRSDEDFERITFLRNKKIMRKDNSEFTEKFQEKLVSEIKLMPVAKSIIENYFVNSFSNNKAEFRKQILKIIEGS